MEKDIVKVETFMLGAQVYTMSLLSLIPEDLTDYIKKSTAMFVKLGLKIHIRKIREKSRKQLRKESGTFIEKPVCF